MRPTAPMAVNQLQLSTPSALHSFQRWQLFNCEQFLLLFNPPSYCWPTIWSHTPKTTPEPTHTHFCGIEWMWLTVDSLQERTIKYPTSVYSAMRSVWVRDWILYIPGWAPHMEDLKHMWKLLFGGKVTETLDNCAKCIQILTLVFIALVARRCR